MRRARFAGGFKAFGTVIVEQFDFSLATNCIKLCFGFLCLSNMFRHGLTTSNSALEFL